ncbi:MAG: hypothetical protein KF791_07455 [Verrucomicrobiae bacterium]|nr:hypothetical protein [Verrucomicrobiae bacterium]
MNTECVALRASVPAAERQRWVQRYREGDLGLRRFAEVHGLRASQLHYWIYGGRGAKSRKAADVLRPAEPMFREVEWVRRSPPDPGGGWDAEIAWRDGTCLRVRRDTDPAWIGALAQAIRRPC